MTVEDFGGRRTISAEELLVVVGDYQLVGDDGESRGRIEAVAQDGLAVVVTVTEGDDIVGVEFAPDEQVTIEPYDGGKAPVVP
ncbi:hypothetical protein HQ346_09030 [Rhodococcus sp. BP-252]|uniref:hypothetical protein n=1 Tax=unclassified Rhodococcus (in: high G+C Gram-positive bacteria) TaxID=192944 RepID=UPI000DF22B76|nr:MULTISPECIES: hypothetical protein [unclassified Rhodococcus (in: high G+C Gram-positive bacteria)]MBY6411444.1 hypothetical protein [Rhodococcus sp. BP-320]MBY6416103.1 hypothetical protein [Rhodococcus sp. BP-321]MBY6420388.1 hypothetical protein [Rhodococcus sp. BP-324]MBY6426310.1 hypothetical protein [Rhodococcus sp. BP-323]MBY6431149.1 hypothetical protein [Rhodococcus sp. BP-322]